LLTDKAYGIFLGKQNITKMQITKKIGVGSLLAVLLFSLASILYHPGATAAYGTVSYNGKRYYPIKDNQLDFGLPTPPYKRTSLPSDCYGGGIVVVDSPGSSSGTVYQTTGDPIQGLGGLGGQLNTIAGAEGLSDKCYVINSVGQAVTIDAKGNAKNVTAPPEKLTSCSANFNSAFSWIVCPMLDLADKIIGVAYAQVEGQLCFNTGNVSSTGGPTCGGANGLSASVQRAWNVFKNIASAVVIIVMLIVVIAQAVSSETFLSAYTVRKMLPRLVAAVILMQLSWPLLKYSIDLSNDAGKAIGDLMMAPFGGPANMKLSALIGHGVKDATGTGAGQFTFDLFTVIASVAALYYLIPALPLLALYVLVGVFIAFFVLVVRKLLIIMLVILAPLAFIAWVIPGTETYWKMWKDNLVKLLLMFPMIMAMLSAGRILAYITANAGNAGLMAPLRPAIIHVGPLPVPYVASVTGFADLAIIIGAFFAPYFLIPKTYSWGGSLMRQAGGYLEKGTERFSKKPQEYLQKNEEGWREERRRRSQERVSGHREYGEYTGPLTSRIDKLRSGQWNPLLGRKDSRRRFEAVAGYAAAGRASSGKTAETANAAAEQLFDSAQDHDYVSRMLMRGEKFDYIDKRGRTRTFDPRNNGYLRAAGAKGIAKYGTDGSNQAFQAEIDRMRAAGGDESLLAEQILDDNVQSMKSKMDSMYRGFNRTAYVSHLASNPGDIQGATRAARSASIKSSVQSMKDSWFDGMDTVEAETLLGGLSHGIASGDPDSKALMKKLWQNYKDASANPNIHITPGVHKAFKAYADGNVTTTPDGKSVSGLDTINKRREGEVQDTIKGDVEEGGKIIRYGTADRPQDTIKVREHRVLDEIVRDEANLNLIRDIGAIDFMTHFDANGSQIRPISRGETAAHQATRATTTSAETAARTEATTPTTSPRPSASSIGQQAEKTAGQAAVPVYSPAARAEHAGEGLTGTAGTIPIDHETFAETVTQATRRGIREGLREARKDGVLGESPRGRTGWSSPPEYPPAPESENPPPPTEEPPDHPAFRQ
jgi:hypothetical protein